MKEEYVSGLRHVLEEDVLPELRALSSQLERMTRQVEASHAAFEAKVDVMIHDCLAMRKELKALREEMKTLREESSGSSSSRLIH